MPSNVFVASLLEICREEGNTVTVEGIRNNALALMQAGEVKTITTATLNGKSMTMSVSKPADVLFAEATEAIRLFNNGIITASTFNFTYL